MKAIELVKYGNASKAFRFTEKEIPQISETEVLIKVLFSGLNFADVVARRGLYPDAPKNPAVLGYDVVGVAERVGSKVSHIKEGDTVTALTRFGGYAEYVKTMGDGVGVVPEGIDLASLTAIATQACTAYYCAEYMVKMQAGDKVLIHAAAGGVGNMLVQLAKHRKCYVIGTASKSKDDYLKSLNVDHVINYREKDFHNEVIIEHGEKSVDFVFDSIGGSTFKKSMKLLGPCGTMVSFGAASQVSGNNKLKALMAALGFGIFSPIQLLMKSQSIIAVNMLRVADHKPQLFRQILTDVIDLTAKGILKPKVSKVYSAKEIVDAHEFLESRNSIGKVVLQWES